MVFISVIITAYDRKEFLMQAVNSALNQTLPRDEYEVIVVKNFEDYDKELEKLGVKTIIGGNKEHGEYVAMGLEESKGEVISLLDDDDLFSPYKLAKVKETFKNHDVVFHSSLYRKIYDNEIPINHDQVEGKQDIFNIKEIKNRNNFMELITNYRIDFNDSRMSIRKTELEKYTDVLKRLVYSVDTFLFSVAVLSGKSLAYDNSKLTYVRVHQKNFSNMSSTDYNIWLEKQIKLRFKYEKAYGLVRDLIMEEYQKSKTDYTKFLLEYVNYAYSLTKIGLKVFKKEEKTSLDDLLNVLKISPNPKYILLYMSGYFPDLLRNLLIKNWYKKNIKKIQRTMRVDGRVTQ